MKNALFIILFLAAVFSLSAQSKWQLDMSAELQSRYVWRGLALGGNAPMAEPSVTLKYGKLALGCWGAYSFGANEYQELDWTLSYTFAKELVTVQLTDYSNPSYASDYHYFDYRSDYTSHVMEAGLLFNVPKTGLSLSGYINFFGNDAQDPNGDLDYSTYAEATYKWTSSKLHADFALAAGCAFAGEKEWSFYGNDGFGVVNLSAEARRTLAISPSFNLPVYCRVAANPVAQKLYFLMGTVVTLP